MIGTLIPWFIVMAVIGALFGLYLGTLFGSYVAIAFYLFAGVCFATAFIMGAMIILFPPTKK